MCTGFIIRQNLDRFPLAQQNITKRRIFHSIIFFKGSLQRHLPALCSAFHQLVNICARYRDRKQTDCCEHGEPSAHIIRNDKTLIPLFIRKILKRSSRLIGRRIDSPRSAFLAVLLLCHLFEHTERDCRLCGRTGFRDHIDREISIADHIDQMPDISRADRIPYEIDLRCLPDRLIHYIIKAVTQKLDCCSCSQIGTANTNHNKHF